MSDASPIMAAGMWDAAPASYRKAPFPAFGGKSRIAPVVWERLGDVRNYVEPFCFSAAMLWKRPVVGAIETINDRNAFVSNFWRAMRADPDAVAYYADWPVNETDLHARHRWLVASARATAQLTKVRDDPEAYDAKIAGWWCWGACCWIGSGWCDETRQEHDRSTWMTRPNLAGDGGGNGVHRADGQLPRLSIANGQDINQACDSGDEATPLPAKLPPLDAAGRGVQGTPSNQLPHLDAGKRPRLASFGEAGLGVAKDPNDRRPGLSQDGWGVNVPGEPPRRRCQLTGNGIGRGVHAGGPDDTHRPQLADEFARGRGVNGHDAASACENRSAWIRGWMRALSDRLRPVRVCCGHWDRVCDSPSTMTRLGTTGVFLDPPYRTHLHDGTANRTRHIYANDRHQDVGELCDQVQAWCLKWGDDPEVRIALCGLEGEYPAIDELVKAGRWTEVAWKSNGGYGNRKGSAENVNARRERVWFSPACLRDEHAGGLFG